MRKNTTERAFVCPACGQRTVAFKKSSKRTAQGHIKTMWCWKCKEVQNMVQLPNYEI